MESISPQINAIHDAFCAAVGYQLPMMQKHERGWYDALKYGMTPDDVKLVVKNRQARIKIGVRRDECVFWRNIAGSDEAIADVLEEAAALRARMRIKAFPVGKQQVLRATGREDAPEMGRAVPVSEVIEALRKAVQ